MRAGRYRHRVHIQHQQRTRGPNGDVHTVWETFWLDSDTPLDSMPAEVLTGPGREFIAAGGKQAETSARINFRWFDGLDQSMRILWDGRTYNITSLETDATGRREWRARCEEGVNDGQ